MAEPTAQATAQRAVQRVAQPYYSPGRIAYQSRRVRQQRIETPRMIVLYKYPLEGFWDNSFPVLPAFRRGERRKW